LYKITETPDMYACSLITQSNPIAIAVVYIYYLVHDICLVLPLLSSLGSRGIVGQVTKALI